jgi:signal transduction histidine kinase
MKPEPQFPGIGRTLHELPDGALEELAPAARLTALGALTAGVVHAVNNALFAILAHVELLLADSAVADDAAERLRLVQQTGLELRETLRRLGALTRGRDTEGAALLDEEVRDTLELLRRTGTVLAPATRFPERELAVSGTSAEVAQAVAHLLLHAAALAGRGGSVAIEVAREGEAGVLRVHASGEPGPEPDRGLGLVVARAIAERLGGSLAADGSTGLRLALPTL